LEHFSHSVGNVIIPTDELIFFRGVETTNQQQKWEKNQQKWSLNMIEPREMDFFSTRNHQKWRLNQEKPEFFFIPIQVQIMLTAGCSSRFLDG